MKRKVQAQRKFAQGAYVPPLQHTNNNIEKRADGVKDEQKVCVTHHDISPSVFLDLVSFANLHFHKKLQPIVRLERLKTNDPSPKDSDTIKSAQAIKTPKKKIQKRKNTKRLNNVSLKYVSENLKPKTLSQIRLSTIKRMKAVDDNVAPRRLVRKRNANSQTQDPDEDDTPLKYFAKNTRNNTSKDHAPVAKRRKPHTTHNSKLQTPKPSPTKQALRKPKQISVICDVSPVKKRTLKKMLRSLPKKKIESHASTKAKPPRKLSSTNATSSENVNESILTANNNEWEQFARMNVSQGSDDPSPPAAEGETSTALVKTRFASLDKFILNPKPAPVVKAAPSKHETPTSATMFARAQSGYYGTNEIQQWINNSMQNRPETEEVFKVPAIPDSNEYGIAEDTKELAETSSEMPLLTEMPRLTEMSPLIEISPFTDMPLLMERPNASSPCPSERYSTVRDVVCAPSVDLERRCRNCSPCARVTKVERLSQMVQRPEPPATADQQIYEFDADDADRADDEAGQKLRLDHYRQQRRVPRPRDPPTIISATEGDNYFYLDLFPENSPHIIQIMSTKIPNQNKQMLRARLMQKSLVNCKNEFSLIEHENLLDQLLETLNMSKQSTGELTKDQPVVVLASGSDTAPAQLDRVSTACTAPAVSGPITATAPLAASVASTPAVPLAATVPPAVNFPLVAIASSTVTTPPVAAIPSTSAQSASCVPPAVPTPPVSSKTVTKNTPKNSNRTKCSTSRPSTSKMATRATPVAKVRNAPADIVSNKKSTQQSSAKRKSNTQKNAQSGVLMNAPIYHPTEEEFKDPLTYIKKIMPEASKYGLCKVVAPKGFQPPCLVKNEIRFNVSNQYIARLYNRWGPATSEMCAIKTYLVSQSVQFNRAPLLNNLEVNLPKLYHVVQKYGGLKKVMEKKKWGRVAEELRNGRPCNPEKLDLLYLRFLLPYDTLSHKERQQIIRSVEKGWKKKNNKMLERASNPLHRQKRLLGESESSGDDTEEENDMTSALTEAEDCVVPGRSMTLVTFVKAAAAAQDTYYGRSRKPLPSLVEQEYWKLVVNGSDHVCVYTASIDTGDEGYGFPTDKNDSYGTHPWNLKMISQNEGNVLRSLGSVLGVTVPTLHLGMMFSTSCWHRDPHGLPWIEYMHRGPPKIWYGIPDEQSDNFRKAVETLCPTSCQNKSIWLPSDITMIPPELLREHNVTLSRVEQSPGEYVIVFPKAYSCSISTGYTQSESVYFATDAWLAGVDRVFHELRENCEPTMFSLEQLLLAIAADGRSTARVLRPVSGALGRLVADELDHRRQLARLGLTAGAAESSNTRAWRRRPAGAWTDSEQDECEVCRRTLYLSKVRGVAGRRAAACLQHALLLLRRDSDAGSGATLRCYYSEDDLRDAVCALDARLRRLAANDKA
ncbi:uncharacterized protein LOC113510896 isoform X2 [Galleria mellonella]|uniref:Uncharacterized protein LOC113510896 isoform X2 n=1 Tax=Galleria mellonella TaxID=7137 RepID=A0A6J1WBC1_GALME|nr:uncharacterized protein LOC113510896 isoform X2 [Galleria mellonella]